MEIEMTGQIVNINTKIPFSEKQVKILVNGKNIIFTGQNGCGKTQLLHHLYNSLEKQIIHRQIPDEEALIQNIEAHKNTLKNISPASKDYQLHSDILINFTKDLNEVRNPTVTINDIENYIINFHDNKSLFIKFDATRQANIKESKAAVSMTELFKQAKNNKLNTATLFEEYLVSNKTLQAYAESPSIDDNPENANKIKKWFDKLQTDLRELFEDESLELIFDSKIQGFFIKQEGKEPYRFQQLSSGFSSILSIYVDLLTKIELSSIAPDEVDGLVFIDEIDAHLHVSLQRKIFLFLDKAFPKVQFIVTTHSPFVVSSVNNALIYDLSCLEEVEDLSMYSFDSIIEGLFKTLPISEMLKEKITKLTSLLDTIDNNQEPVEKLINEIGKHANKLDSESSYFFKHAKIMLNKSKVRGNNV